MYACTYVFCISMSLRIFILVCICILYIVIIYTYIDIKYVLISLYLYTDIIHCMYVWYTYVLYVYTCNGNNTEICILVDIYNLRFNPAHDVCIYPSLNHPCSWSTVPVIQPFSWTKSHQRRWFFRHFCWEGVLWFLFFAAKMGKLTMFKNLTIHLVETTSVDKLWRWKSKLPHLFLLAIESLIPYGGCIYLTLQTRENGCFTEKSHILRKSSRLGWFHLPIPMWKIYKFICEKKWKTTGR